MIQKENKKNRKMFIVADLVSLNAHALYVNVGIGDVVCLFTHCKVNVFYILFYNSVNPPCDI